MSDILILTVTDGIAEVCLNRPERKNAWSWEMFEALPKMARELSQMPDLRAVILRGAGGCFSSGLDTSIFAQFAGDIAGIKAKMATHDGPRGANMFQLPCVVWQELPVPVIAAIDGVAFGAGLQLALAADFRIASPDAKLSIREAKWGLIPDMGITQTLPRLMRADQAKELLMTGKSLQADEAQALGLVTHVAEDPLGAAKDMARELALTSPDALRQGKQLIERAWTNPDGLQIEAALQSEIIGGPNQIEAVMAGMQKRVPNFK